MDDGIRTLALYLAAAALYIVLGVFFPYSVLSIWQGIAYLLVTTWLVPALVARMRRR